MTVLSLRDLRITYHTIGGGVLSLAVPVRGFKRKSEIRI